MMTPDRAPLGRKPRRPGTKRGSNHEKRSLTVALVLMFLVGYAVLIYPAVTNYVNSMRQSSAIADYDSAISDMPEDENVRMLEEAEDYNRRLNETPMSFDVPSKVEGYRETLDITGTGIMGYIDIEKISVRLPIYHGTDSSVLSAAVGHLEGSSLPVGGESTHACLSAHRGDPNAELFTDLDELEKGDMFTITVLNRRLTYEVDKIEVVLPTEVDSLRVVPGEDYCTLITCTPYGVNTHRLLVRGRRVKAAESLQIYVVNSAVRTPDIAVLTVDIPAFYLIIIILIWKKSGTRGKRDQGHFKT